MVSAILVKPFPLMVTDRSFSGREPNISLRKSVEDGALGSVRPTFAMASNEVSCWVRGLAGDAIHSSRKFSESSNKAGMLKVGILKHGEILRDRSESRGFKAPNYRTIVESKTVVKMKSIAPILTSNELRCNSDTSKYSSDSDMPTKLSFVSIVIELPAKDNDRKFFNNCISTGTLVKSLSDRSKILNEDMLWANSWETVGSSFSPTRKTRNSGSGKSGISVSDTLLRPNLIRLPWSPTNALSITLSSLLFDRSKSAKRGNEANAASSILSSWLLDKSKKDNAYKERF